MHIRTDSSQIGRVSLYTYSNRNPRKPVLNTGRKLHWEQVYSSKGYTEVSWFQLVPEKSLGLIRSTGAPLASPILDVGGGAATLVDNLLSAGYEDVSILDIAAGAFEQSRDRLGALADKVTWILSDVTTFEPPRRYAIWHDRAVFHFLTCTEDRDRYLHVLRNALQPDGHLLLATFGPDGPLRCSGLEIQRYSVEKLQGLLGTDFVLQAHEIDEHQTPSGATQQFLYGRWQFKG